VLTALRGLPTQSYYRYLPRTLNRSAPPLVCVHGISRNARDHARGCLPLAEELGCALIAPLFSREFCRGFQLLGLDGRGQRADLLLERIVREVASTAEIEAERCNLFGFSGGAQFAHRYAMYHPARVARLVVSSAGWYTVPDPELRFPYGLQASPLPLSPEGLNAFLAIPQLVSVGGEDSCKDRHVRSEPSLNARQGRTRVERAVSYAAEIHRAAAQRRIQPRVRLAVVAGATHDFRDCMARGLDGLLLRWFGAADPIQTLDAGKTYET
jgi:pimeloyl-ACP methyl ester carboxylesterase